MDDVREVDPLLQRVRQATRRFQIPSDSTITQQILLFGDSFYGYRFTTSGFTVIWSAAEQTIKICDPDGQVVEVSSTAEVKRAA